MEDAYAGAGKAWSGGERKVRWGGNVIGDRWIESPARVALGSTRKLRERGGKTTRRRAKDCLPRQVLPRGFKGWQEGVTVGSPGGCGVIPTEVSE
jgi:hypothetical protein